jgi:hypothetical protein
MYSIVLDKLSNPALKCHRRLDVFFMSRHKCSETRLKGFMLCKSASSKYTFRLQRGDLAEVSVGSADVRLHFGEEGFQLSV